MTSCYEDGPEDAPICLVGESPSFMELRENKPFVGPSGQLLDKLLHSAQIPRFNLRILNVFETAVKKPRQDQGKIYSQNDVLLWTSKKGFTDAGREASKGCLDRLRASKANATCSLGGPALHLCVDTRSVSKWRGSIIPGIDGRKVIPTLHPAHALQGAYESRYLIAADLKRVRAESSSPEIVYDQRNLKIDPTFSECIAYLGRALQVEALDTDIELYRGSVDCFSIALSPSEAISIPIVDATGPRWTPSEELQIWQAYAKIIASPRITKVNQNIGFDLAVLLQLNNMVPRGPIADPMAAFSVMNPFLPKKLGVISSLYTREPYYKDDGELEDSPTIDDFARRWLYNAKDSVVALESWLKLDRELDKEGYRVTYEELTAQTIPSLIWMMNRGVRVNSEALARTKGDTKSKIASLVTRMGEVFGRPVITDAPKKAAEKRAALASGAININSPKQLCEYFYGEKKFRTLTSGTGKPSVDDKALARLARQGSKEAKLIQEYRSLNTLLSRYLDISFDRDGRLRCNWNVRGTWTGRLSSSQTVFSTGGNLQNLPDTMRSFLEADDAA
jgi:uracil-DNA glycosylase